MFGIGVRAAVHIDRPRAVGEAMAARQGVPRRLTCINTYFMTAQPIEIPPNAPPESPQTPAPIEEPPGNPVEEPAPQAPPGFPSESPPEIPPNPPGIE